MSPLKAGHSNRIEANNNPVNYTDPAGLQPSDPSSEYDSVRIYNDMIDGTFNWDNVTKLGLSILEALNLVDPKGIAVDAIIDAAAEGSGVDGEGTLFKYGTRKSRKREARKSLHKYMKMPSHLTNSRNNARKKLGLSKREFEKAIHKVKPGSDDNPDVYIDPVTGDVYDPRSLEWIGNLLDECR